jgi:hypothetical protein
MSWLSPVTQNRQKQNQPWALPAEWFFAFLGRNVGHIAADAISLELQGAGKEAPLNSGDVQLRGFCRWYDNDDLR